MPALHRREVRTRRVYSDAPFLNEGADVDAKDARTGETPLHKAGRAGAMQAARVLVDRGASIVDSEFSWLGDSGVALWGDSIEYDATGGNYPKGTLVSGKTMQIAFACLDGTTCDVLSGDTLDYAGTYTSGDTKRSK